jgi:hypothetical protein
VPRIPISEKDRDRVENRVEIKQTCMFQKKIDIFYQTHLFKRTKKEFTTHNINTDDV